MTITREMAGILVSCRQQALLTADLDAALTEARAGRDGIHGQTDSPGGGGDKSTSNQERYIIREAKLLDKHRRAKDRLKELTRQARGIILQMEDGMARFAMLYYVEALEPDEITGAMQVSEKTGRRWRDEIERSIRG